MNSTMLQILKNTAFVAAKSPAGDRFVKLLESTDRYQPGILRVLTYHRIDEPTRRPWLDPALISASPKAFDEQMAYLAACYRPVTISEVLAALKSQDKNDLPPRAVLVTFDDGYVDFEEQAWPILSRYKVPAVLFVPTAYPDHPEQTFWWDELHQALQYTNRNEKLETAIGTFSLSTPVSRYQAYKRLRDHMKTLSHAEAILSLRELCRELDVQPAANCIMSWDSLRKLSRDGLALGAHTRTHPLLNQIPLDAAREEARGSLEDLRREIGSVRPILAYPGGQSNNEVVHMLAREGFALAFTTRRGINHMDQMDPFRIKRINVGGRTPLPVLRAELLPWAAHFNRAQSRIDA